MRHGGLRMKNPRLVAAVVFLVILIAELFMMGIQDVSDSEMEAISLDHVWIGGERDARNGLFDQLEGTDGIVYFSYNMAGYIDAFDLSGQYLYTIHVLDDSQNGSIQIDCRDGLLYVQSRHDALLIFDGTELLERIEREEAEEQGLRLTRRHEQSDYSLTDTHVVRADGNETVPIFLIPEEIAFNLTRERLRLYAGLAMLAAVVVKMIYDRIRK